MLEPEDIKSAAPESHHAIEVESYVRGFVRRRPDVALTVLRFTNFIGPRIDSPLTRYLSLPAVPTVLGHDPRIQLCHSDDALEILRRATLEDHPGTFNAGGDGLLLLSQAVRRTGRPAVPVPPGAVSIVGNLLRRAGRIDFSPEQMRFLNFGRVVDTTVLRTEFGVVPRYTTAEALADYARTVPPVVSPRLVGTTSTRLRSSNCRSGTSDAANSPIGTKPRRCRSRRS